MLAIVSDEETGGKYGAKHLLEGHGAKATCRGTCVPKAEARSLNFIWYGEKCTLRMKFEMDTEDGHAAYMNVRKDKQQYCQP